MCACVRARARASAYNSLSRQDFALHKYKNVSVMEFMYLLFTRMPGESYRWRLGSFVVVVVWPLLSAD